METLIEIIGFVASSISTKSSLSATSPLHGGGVLGGPGTGPTHTDPTHIPIHPSDYSGYGNGYGNYGYAMVMDRPAMITDMSPRL